MVNIEWIASKGELHYEAIKTVEKQWGIKFPDDFVECVLKNDGASPEPSAFNFEGKRGASFGFLLSFRPDNEIYILDVYNRIKKALPKSVFPFADDPAGNFICFDYRQDPTGPKVVFWDHEWDKVIPVCDRFTDLINKLY
jgi:cell wall assembly regulator SMI1